jgi:hypothetical protein
MTATTPPSSPLRRWAYENSLLLVPGLLMIATLAGQAITGWHVHNDERLDMSVGSLSFASYLTSGHFLEATFENWESEFLQMGLYVLLTIWLRQKGSSESKKLYEEEPVDAEPDPEREGAPWPVRRGGVALWLYERSLSIAFTVLFLASLLVHAHGGVEVYNLENGELLTMWQYMGTSQFWFESLQNWQSEILSIIAIVGLSVVLRQKGSPESKPVDTPHGETEE